MSNGRGGLQALVTGGGGFLGGAIVRQLLARGDQVWSFARGDYPELEALGVQVLRGDLARADEVDQRFAEAAAAGCETVFHVAALAGSWGPRAAYQAVNVDGTDHVIAACRRHGLKRLVYTSSPSVVLCGRDVEGGDESLPYPEQWLAHYPATKAVAEQRVLAANGEELGTISLRPHLIWGPGDGHLLPRLVDRSRRGRLRRIGNGDKLIDAIYIDDAARAHLLADDRLLAECGRASATSDDGRRADRAAVAGRAFFITADDPIETWTMVNHLLAAAGEPPVTKSISARAARNVGAILETVWRLLRRSTEPPMTRWVAEELSTSHWFNVSAARRDLGYAPQVSLDDGLARLRSWCAEGGLEA